MANHHDLDSLDYSLDHVLCAVFPNGTPQIVRQMVFEGVDREQRQHNGAYLIRYRNVTMKEQVERSRYLRPRAGRDPAKPSADSRPWHLPPSDPIDAFALAAVLMARSGAYHHVQAFGNAGDAHGDRSRRILAVTDKDREEARKQADSWRRRARRRNSIGRDRFVMTYRVKPPPGVVRAWNVILEAAGAAPQKKKGPCHWRHQSAKVFKPLAGDVPAPDWWRAALTIMMIADEAARGIGFDAPINTIVAKAQPDDGVTRDERLNEMLFRRFMALPFELLLRERKEDAEERLQTLSLANPDIICVLPKSRTPSLGCTMRSMSHHLAALPPRGVARAAWLSMPQVETRYTGDKKTGDARPAEARAASRQVRTHNNALNLLLIPYPYAVSTHHFRASFRQEFNGQRWGRFVAGPQEEPDSTAAFVSYVGDLLDNAEKDLGEIHGVVFPELALSLRMFRTLMNGFSRERKRMELLVAGLNSGPMRLGAGDEREVHGNFSAMCVFGRRDDDPEDYPLRYDSRIREKHHRWMLTEDQIATYSLGAALDPSYRWSEDLTILSRS